jgi:SAM-dependent methyltransferase
MDVRKETVFFDDFTAEHGEYDVLGEGAYRRLLSWFHRLVQPKPGEACIDLGCGTGAFTRRLRAFDLALYGMDISPRSVARANDQAAGERYLVGDIRSTGLPAGDFDIVVYSGVLHHCDERSLRIDILREGYRLLKPGGRLFAYDPSAHSPSMFLYRDPRSPFYSKQGKTDNEVLLTRKELQDELRAAGFRNLSIRGSSGITFRYVHSRAARLLLPFYNLYEHLVRLSPLEDRWGTFLVTFAAK